MEALLPGETGKERVLQESVQRLFETAKAARHPSLVWQHNVPTIRRFGIARRESVQDFVEVQTEPGVNVLVDRRVTTRYVLGIKFTRPTTTLLVDRRVAWSKAVGSDTEPRVPNFEQWIIRGESGSLEHTLQTPVSNEQFVHNKETYESWEQSFGGAVVRMSEQVSQVQEALSHQALAQE